MKRIAIPVAALVMMLGGSATAETILNIPGGIRPVIEIKDLTEGNRWSLVSIYVRPEDADADVGWAMVYEGRAQKDYLQDTAITKTRWDKFCPTDKGCQVRIEGKTGVGNGSGMQFDRGNVLPQNDDGTKTSRIDIEMYGPGEDRPSAQVLITFDKDAAPPCGCKKTKKPL